MKTMSFTRFFLPLALVGCCGPSAHRIYAQTPSSLYSWDGTGDIQQWIRSFGAANTSATLANTVPGELTLTETSATAGGSQAFSDNFNRVRGLPSGPSGGLDLTGLSYLEFDLGHNGAGNINVQFYVQATPGSTFVALGPDLAVTPGVNTYQVPLGGLTADQLVYIRTMGINVRDHAGLGNVAWTIRDLRSIGPALTSRTLVTFDNGTAEGGLQGAIVNFDNASVMGNNGGQNQTGLSHNASGSGSLQWTDVAGGNGAAVSWGNGTAWNGNTFNNRTTDLSNYERMIVRMSATETATSNGGLLNIQGFFQTGAGFAFQSAGILGLPIDGQYHDLEFNIVGLTDMNVIDTIGLNLGSHSDELQINVDNVLFMVPEPTSGILLLGGLIGLGLATRRNQRSA